MPSHCEVMLAIKRDYMYKKYSCIACWSQILHEKVNKIENQIFLWIFMTRGKSAGECVGGGGFLGDSLSPVVTPSLPLSPTPTLPAISQWSLPCVDRKVVKTQGVPYRSPWPREVGLRGLHGILGWCNLIFTGHWWFYYQVMTEFILVVSQTIFRESFKSLVSYLEKVEQRYARQLCIFFR